MGYIASVARKERSVFRDYMCTWLTALAVLRYAPDYGDFGQITVMFPEWPKATQCAPLLPGYACCVGQTQTAAHHVERAWNLIQAASQSQS